MVAIFISALPNIMLCTKLEFINTVEAKEREKENDKSNGAKHKQLVNLSFLCTILMMFCNFEIISKCSAASGKNF